jgi:PDZ domain-containing protein
MAEVRSARRIAMFLVLAALLVGASTVWLPYYSIGPGPAREVAPLIRVSGRSVYASAGRFVMTSVHIGQLTAVGTLLAWLDPHRAVVKREEVYAPGESTQEERRRAISQMDQSKLDAAYVVLHELEGYPKEHGRGVLVESVVDGCAADGELFPGDLITAIDGAPIPGLRAASRAIESAPSGSTLRFDVTVDGEPEHVDLTRQPCGGEAEPLVGLRMIPRFPFPITISSGDIGGPSAGLMWAVTLHDLLTPGDLTGGRTIAGTGAIGIDGSVYPIGGIEEKIVAAKDAGADVLLVPEDNLREARAAGIGGIRLVPVGTFDQALAWLRGHA